MLASEAMRLTAAHLDGYATVLGVDDCAALDAAMMRRTVDVAVALAVDGWLATRPVSVGGLVLDPPAASAAA
ncbi:MAG: hypothetical protein DLM59_18520 [Pseudonocardiales bacterium]|nr:MAG: hypothetical protein DLM59_18520 [Pseudonocardiales bacterium]